MEHRRDDIDDLDEHGRNLLRDRDRFEGLHRLRHGHSNRQPQSDGIGAACGSLRKRGSGDGNGEPFGRYGFHQLLVEHGSHDFDNQHEHCRNV
jgi:hypothetical protein